MNTLEIKFRNRNNQEETLSDYPAKYYVIVNTASKCGFAPQLEGLEQLYNGLSDQGIVVIGFPSNQFNEELNSADEAYEFCKLNYGVTFPFMGLTTLNGEDEAPLYTELKKQMTDEDSADIKWNYTKFIVNSKGRVIRRFAPSDEPKLIFDYLELLLDEE